MPALARLKSIITNECQLKNIHQEHIADGIGHAEMLLDQGEEIADCIREGIAIAEGQNRRYNFRIRAA